METKIKEEHIFKEKGHTHWLDGKRLTGVTTVLGVLDKPYLLPWAAGMTSKYIQENSNPIYHEDDLLYYEVHPKVLEDAKKAYITVRDSAGKKGTDTHAIIEEIIKDVIENSGGYIRSGRNPNKQIQRFIDWAIEKKVKFLASEKLVHSKELFVGGICDFICEIDGKRYIGDVKTGKMVDPSYFWQTSAYDYCLNEMGEGLAGRYVIVRLGKDELDKDGNVIKEGSFEVAENYSFDDNVDGFKACLTIYRKKQLIEK